MFWPPRPPPWLVVLALSVANISFAVVATQSAQRVAEAAARADMAEQRALEAEQRAIQLHTRVLAKMKPCQHTADDVSRAALSAFTEGYREAERACHDETGKTTVDVPTTVEPAGRRR